MPVISCDRSTTVTSGKAPGNATWWCLLIVLCVVLVAPLTLADVPPLLDYPNHMARLFVLASLPTDPVLARFYMPHWAIIPNLALDLTVPPLLRIFPVSIVGRAVVGVTLLLPVLGCVAYHRALTGRLSYWPLGSVLFVYNGALLRGFLNFIAAVGLAMLLAAVWIAWRDRRPLLTIMISAAGAVALFFCHLVGLLFFAILVGSHELLILRTDPISFDTFRRRIGAVIVVFVAPVALYAVSDLGHMANDAEFRPAAGKVHAALMPVMNYFWPLDLVTAALIIALLAVGLARRWLAIPLRGAAAMVVLLALFVGLPAELKGTNDLDTRFIVMAAAMLPAVLVPVALPRRAFRTIGIGFLLLFSVRITVLAVVWHDWTSYLAEFRSVIEPVRPGDVVLTVRLRRESEHDLWTAIATGRYLSDGTVVDGHLPGLLLIEHRAWWPFLFDNDSQQPIQGRQPYRALGWKIDSSPNPIALLVDDASASRLVTHVLIWGRAPAADEVPTEGLHLLAENPHAALFAVSRNQISRLPLPALPIDR
jgi:hypothetical protein